jgi:hypothetical protein
MEMADRLPALLPRLAAIVLLGLALTATLTYAAGRNPAAPATPRAAAVRKAAPLVIPDLRNQAFVFAKGLLEDKGFAWRVAGSVRGYASNTVVRQSPAPGTKLIQTGSPLITVTLARNGSYPQTGAPEDASPYTGTPLRLADAAVAPAPKLAQPKAATPKATQTTRSQSRSRPRSRSRPHARRPSTSPARARSRSTRSRCRPALRSSAPGSRHTRSRRTRT